MSESGLKDNGTVADQRHPRHFRKRSRGYARSLTVCIRRDAAYSPIGLTCRYSSLRVNERNACLQQSWWIGRTTAILPCINGQWRRHYASGCSRPSDHHRPCNRNHLDSGPLERIPIRPIAVAVLPNRRNSPRMAVVFDGTTPMERPANKRRPSG